LKDFWTILQHEAQENGGRSKPVPVRLDLLEEVKQEAYSREGALEVVALRPSFADVVLLWPVAYCAACGRFVQIAEPTEYTTCSRCGEWTIPVSQAEL